MHSKRVRKGFYKSWENIMMLNKISDPNKDNLGITQTGIPCAVTISERQVLSQMVFTSRRCGTSPEAVLVVMAINCSAHET